MTPLLLRDGVELDDPLVLALGFLEAYPVSGPDARPSSFDEYDLRLANRGGARISGAQIAGILDRRRRIERVLRQIPPDASLAARSVPWEPLARLFGCFAEIPGVGFSKATKALHPKRPALIPMLDSVVQAYLPPPPPEAFADQAIALTRAYKRDLDRNRVVLRELKRELARRGYELTEVRLLDVLIWSLGSV